MKATESMLESLRQAVKATEVSWDAMRDIEVEAGKEFRGLDAWIHDIAVVGSESVTLEDLQQFLDEEEHFSEGDND